MENRNTGIDLLRIILMYMIVISHVLSHGGIIETAKNNLHALLFLEIICNCAVNGYALISGYFALDKPTNYKRIIRLWFIALFYSLSFVLGLLLLNKILNINSSISTIDIIHALLPVSFGNWYFQAYFGLFFLMPFINKAIHHFDQKQSKTLLILLFLIFSCLTLINDNYAANGYSVFWLLILYIIGALINKTKILNNIKSSILLILFLITSTTTFFFKINNMNNFTKYTSPTVLLAAIFLLIIFSRIIIKTKAISTIASLTFGIYLFHDNIYFRNYFMSGRFTFVNNYNIVISIIMVLIISLIIFMISSIIEYLRNLLFKIIKIDSLIDSIIE